MSKPKTPETWVDKLLTYLTVILVTAAVLMVSSNSFKSFMRERAAAKLPPSITYFIPAKMAPSTIIEDNQPLLIEEKMQPVDFAGRELAMLVTLKAFPTDPVKYGEQLEKKLLAWEDKGNRIGALSFDYQGKTPDFKKFSSFIDAINDALILDPRIIAVVGKLDWPEDKNLIRDKISFITIDLDTPNPAPDILKQLRDLDQRFVIRLPATIDAETATKSILRKNKLFSGFIFPPPPKPKESLEDDTGSW